MPNGLSLSPPTDRNPGTPYRAGECRGMCSLLDGLLFNERFGRMSTTKLPLKHRVKKIVKVVLTVVAFTIGGFLVGLFIQSPIVETISDGTFTRWRTLGSPPEKITRLLGIGQYGAQNVIYAETETDQVFRCCPQAIGEWEETKAPEYLYGQICGSLPLKSSPPPQAVKGCFEEAAFEWVTDRYQYALLEDGTVWLWHHYVGLDTIIKIVLISSLIGGVIGLLFVWQNERKKR